MTNKGSINLAIVTAIRMATITVPDVILVLGLDPTDSAGGLTKTLHSSPRFARGGLAELRMSTLLQEDWRALGLSQRSRGLDDGDATARTLSQAFGLLVLSIRRATRPATVVEACDFGSSAPRSQTRISRLRLIDWIFYVICLAVPLASIGVAVDIENWHFAFQGV